MEIVTRDQLAAVDWSALLKDCERHTYLEYHMKLSMKLDELGEGDEQRPVIELIRQICSMKQREDDEPGDPFLPLNVSAPFLPQHLSKEQAEELYSFLMVLDNPVLKARIADTLWVNRKIEEKYPAAKTAIAAYIEASKRSDTDNFMFGTLKWLSRAASIARELGKGGAEVLDEVLSEVKTILAELRDKEVTSRQLKLLRLLYRYDRFEPGIYAEYSEAMAEDCEKNGRWILGPQFWEMAADWRRAASDEDGLEKVKIYYCESFVKQADAAPNKMAECRFLQNAIEAYRRVGGHQKEVDVLHDRLLKAEKDSVQEMHEISSGSIDISEAVQNAIKAVSGKSLIDGLFTLAVIVHPHDPKKLKKIVMEEAEEYPLSHLFDGARVSREGKVLAKIPGFKPGGVDIEDVTKPRMHEKLRFYQRLDTQAYIIPAIDRLLLEHQVTLEEMHGLVSRHPFVPKGREALYARGLKAGFDNDFTVASHLLVPQFENSLRHLIERQGGIASKLNDEGIQQEMGMDECLGHPLIKKSFDEETLYTFRMLLVERTGDNFRNELAHGLIDGQGFYSFTAIYFWWMVLRIICMPYIISKDQREKADAEKPGGGEES